MNISFDCQKMKTRRREKGLTQTELATIIGVDQREISRWENGMHEPSISCLKKIAQALDCTVDEII